MINLGSSELDTLCLSYSHRYNTLFTTGYIVYMMGTVRPPQRDTK